jgi:hypothetical protein
MESSFSFKVKDKFEEKSNNDKFKGSSNKDQANNENKDNEEKIEDSKYNENIEHNKTVVNAESNKTDGYEGNNKSDRTGEKDKLLGNVKLNENTERDDENNTNDEKDANSEYIKNDVVNSNDKIKENMNEKAKETFENKERNKVDKKKVKRSDFIDEVSVDAKQLHRIQPSRLQRRREKSTVILASIIVIFIACHSYRLSLKIFEFSHPQSNTMEHFEKCFRLKRFHVPAVIYILTNVHHLFLVLNSSINFIVYCCIGK